MLFAATAVGQLLRFRDHNGVWVSGPASRVVLGTANASSTAYLLALGAAVWAALADRWWLVVLSAGVGVATYTVGGRLWWRQYQGAPSRYSRGESLALTVGDVVVALAGAPGRGLRQESQGRARRAADHVDLPDQHGPPPCCYLTADLG